MLMKKQAYEHSANAHGKSRLVASQRINSLASTRDEATLVVKLNARGEPGV